jgi:hypothetical protein
MADYLLPDEDQPTSAGGVLSLAPPATVLSATPRANGTGSIVVSGTVANGNTFTVTFSGPLFPTPLAIQIAATAGDTPTTVAEKLAAAIMANTTLQGYGVIAEASGTGTINFTWPGPLGTHTFVTITPTTSGAATFVTTQLSGGSGPIIPTADNTVYVLGMPIVLKHNRPFPADPVTLPAIVAALYNAIM